MFRCPFMPCMNCPYYAGPDMKDNNQMQMPENVNPISNIPPVTPIPNVSPMNNVSPLSNTSPMSNVSPMTNTSPMSNVSPMANTSPMSNVSPMTNVPPMSNANVSPAEQMPKPKMENMTNQAPTENNTNMAPIEEKVQPYTEEDKKNNKNVESDAYIRVLHASPDAPPFDIFMDHKKLIEDLSYGMLVGYMPIESGQHNIEVFIKNKTKNPILSTTMDFPEDTFSTVATVGRLANIEPLLIDDYEDKVPKNNALLKFVHMSPNAPAVDVTLHDGKKLFTNISFKQVTDYIMVTPGKYNMQLKLAGTNTIVLNMQSMNIQGGIPYSIYAIGMAGGIPPLTAVLIEDEI